MKTWILDDPITPSELNRIELALSQTKFGGTTTGTATNLTATVTDYQSLDLTSVFIKAHIDFAAGATLNVSGTGARPIYTSDGNPIVAGTIKAGSIVKVVFNASNSRWYVLSGGGAAYTPPYTAVNKAGDVMGGNLAINAAATQTGAGRNYLSVRGTSDAGGVELTSGAADVDGTTLGVIQIVDKNSTAADKRVAMMMAATSGATTNNRGGSLSFWTKPNAVSGQVQRLLINNVGAISTGNNNVIDDGAGAASFTGPITLNTEPTTAKHAVTKGYVDGKGGGFSINTVNAWIG